MKQWSLLSLFLITALACAPVQAHKPGMFVEKRQLPQKESKIKQLLKDNIANICIAAGLVLAVIWTMMKKDPNDGNGGKGRPTGPSPDNQPKPQDDAPSQEEIQEEIRTIKVDGLRYLGMVGLNPTDEELKKIDEDDFIKECNRLLKKNHPDKHANASPIVQARAHKITQSILEIRDKLKGDTYWPPKLSGSIVIY